MYKKLASTLLALITPLIVSAPSWADTVMERVAKTGTLVVATRTDLLPFAYLNEKEELTGYSVEIVELIREQLEKELGRKVEVNYVTYETFGDRIEKIVSREIDLSCDTVFTWDRDKFVDFSVGYGVSGMKLLVNSKSGIKSPESLEGKRIGIIETSLDDNSVKLIEDKAKVVTVDNIEAGFDAVKEGKIEAFLYDATILAGMKLTRDERDSYMIIPEQSYFRHGIACMVPENDSSFLNLVNYSIVKMMEGYIAEKPRYQEIVNRYFAQDGIVPYDSDNIKNFFEMIIMTREQIPPDELD
jgi:polar amino acid transport system substrate-binding protein